MLLPVRLLAGRAPRLLETRASRFVWSDPRVVLDPDATPAAYSRAMAAFTVGSTIKITGPDRHPLADALLEQLDLRGATILEIGVSDGTNSVDLMDRLPGFGSFIMSDLFGHAKVVRVARQTVFLDHRGAAVLCVGRHLLAWPGSSRPVALAYGPWVRAARRRSSSGEPVLLLNPRARQRLQEDDRVTFVQHDVFQPWSGPPPDVIKVANVLRRLYFSDDEIRRGLDALHASLPEAGHLLMVDNPRAKKAAPCGGLYRREGHRFVRVDRTKGLPEVDDLVLEVGRQELALRPARIGRQ